MRAWLLAAVPFASSEDHCSSTTVRALLALFGAGSVEELATKLLQTEQDQCAAGSCPTVDLAGCPSQSVDDVTCEIKDVFSTSVKLGTDAICDTGCDDWPCVAACDGIDVGICYAGDYVLCKAGCLGIKKCVEKCEHAIVDPCKDKLIHQCKDKCDAAFNQCKESCEAQLTMEISADFQRLSKALSSASITSLDATCNGNGILNPLNISALASIHFEEVQVDMKVHLKDVGIHSDNDLSLKKIQMTVNAPLDGSLQCGVKRDVSLRLGELQITDVNLDADLAMDSAIGTIASVVCADLPFCKDAVKNAIGKAIKDEVVKQVPGQLAKSVGPLLQSILDTAHCPKLIEQDQFV